MNIKKYWDIVCIMVIAAMVHLRRLGVIASRIPKAFVAVNVSLRLDKKNGNQTQKISRLNVNVSQDVFHCPTQCHFIKLTLFWLLQRGTVMAIQIVAFMMKKSTGSGRMNIHGEYECVGVCQDCEHNTTGINCNECKAGCYRSCKTSRSMFVNVSRTIQLKTNRISLLSLFFLLYIACNCDAFF